MVDEILGVGNKDPEHPLAPQTTRNYLEGEAFLALTDLLERHTQSIYYKEGISYSLLKVAELGLVPAAKILLQYGADLSFEDPVTYYTALHIAVLRDQPEMVQLLVQSGADINRRDRIHESSPLDLASEEPERLPCLKRLLDLGADVNAADKNSKTALLHALASSDGVQIHNIENIRLLLEGGADAKATTKDCDTVFTYIIFLLGEIEVSDQEEVKLIKHFSFKVSQLLLAHGADPSDCPSHESLTYTCLKNFKFHLPLLCLLLEYGASYNCSQHGPSCWSGFQIVFDKLCGYLSSCDSCDSADLLQKAECVMELMISQSPQVILPRNFEINTANCSIYAEKVAALHQSYKQLEHSPPTLKHLSRVFIRRRLMPWPVDVKVKVLPLPDRLKWYLLINHTAHDSNLEDL
ncbi:hypothetical protein GDO86_015192 [Hymenochirus boettgeri]|uniref:SOCS box domain-containing protein n=1 Tax=Hymenochirus boettgeri TaxID=247094 RepID=A0A8T2JXR8_9PIPI|nr:hypothetical protein GDO86_015192 [Hymenochirus boettgeri]